MITTKEVAELLAVKPITIRRRANSGEIPSIKIGNRLRFDRRQIEKWVLEKLDRIPAQILVVDDDLSIVELFKESLNESDCQVTTTSSSLEALELIGNKHFDLIFLDLLMPELDGAELFRRIRQMDKAQPVAIITGHPDSDVMNRAMEYGPFTVLKKPFTGDDILSVVRSFVRRVATKE